MDPNSIATADPVTAVIALVPALRRGESRVHLVVRRRSSGVTGDVLEAFLAADILAVVGHIDDSCAPNVTTRWRRRWGGAGDRDCSV